MSVLTAGDIKADAEVEILNPDLHIATLGPGASLSWKSQLITDQAMFPQREIKKRRTKLIPSMR